VSFCAAIILRLNALYSGLIPPCHPKDKNNQSACAKQNDGLLSHTGFHDEILDPGVFKLNRKAISSLVLTAGYP